MRVCSPKWYAALLVVRRACDSIRLARPYSAFHPALRAEALTCSGFGAEAILACSIHDSRLSRQLWAETLFSVGRLRRMRGGREAWREALKVTRLLQQRGRFV